MSDYDSGETTLDGFLDNQFKVFQPRSGGHRSGLDAVLLAACVPEDASGNLADFGAGCGVAGMAVAQRCAGLDVDLLENDGQMAALCRQSLELKDNSHLADRTKLLQVDVTQHQDGNYAYIIANPPFNDGRFQASPHHQRADAHVMQDDLLNQWVKAAARLSKSRATLTLVLRPESLALALNVLDGRFGGVRVLPVHTKRDEKATRLLLRGTKSSKAALRILPSFVIQGSDGRFTDVAEDLLRGRSGISL